MSCEQITSPGIGSGGGRDSGERIANEKESRVESARYMPEMMAAGTQL